MSESPHLGLGYLAPSQAQKHVTVNEAFRRLDAVVQLGVLDRTLTTPPPTPAEGDRHIVPAGATGAWAGQAGRIAAFLDGGWTFIEPKPGWLAFVAAESVIVAFGSGVWSGSLTSLETLTKLGLNATADEVNRLAVSGPAALFNHAGAGVQVKLNKASAADVASFLFQRGFSGRAEFGLVGSDGFSLKVSADGSAWTTALSVDPASGAVSLPATQHIKVDKFTANGTWTKPAWASRVLVELVQGGHGGGAGGVRGAGVAVSGGGGGAPPCVVVQEFAAADLPATVAVTVGAGGAGGASVSSDADGNAGTIGGNSTFGIYARTSVTSNARGAGGVQGANVSGGALDGGRFVPGLIGTFSGAGGSTTTPTVVSNGPGRLGAGAGGGGGLTAANVAASGGTSGINRLGTPTSRTISADANGAVADTIYLAPGDSGGGGSASATANGGPGGAGAIPGGSGGGGGAARNGFSSGKGGDGARGEVWVTSYR